MPLYNYRAWNSSGKPVKGTLEAATKDELVAKLRKMGYTATGVDEAKKGQDTESVYEKMRPIGAHSMILFYTQLSNMINAGIPIVTSLETLSAQISNKKLKNTVGSITRRVEAGDSFSQALSGYMNVFPKFFINMVKAGEVSGKLDTVVLRYSQYFEYQTDLNAKIQGALFYPSILTVAGIAVTVFIVTVVIPQFASIFQKVGIALPVPTLVLFQIGTAIKKYWYIFIAAIALIIYAIRRYARTDNGRLQFDRFNLNLPIVGDLVRKIAISRFARTLGTLTASGVPILESLDITKDVVGNEVISRVIGHARKSVEKGDKMSEPFSVSSEFPPDTIQMIKVGEETGDMDGMLGKIADFYDMSVSYSIKRLTTLIEPLFLVIMGSLVGFIMVSLLLPIFDMMKMLRG